MTNFVAYGLTILSVAFSSMLLPPQYSLPFTIGVLSLCVIISYIVALIKGLEE